MAEANKSWLLNMIKVALSTALLGVVTVILEYFLDILTSQFIIKYSSTKNMASHFFAPPQHASQYALPEEND